MCKKECCFEVLDYGVRHWCVCFGFMRCDELRCIEVVILAFARRTSIPTCLEMSLCIVFKMDSLPFNIIHLVVRQSLRYGVHVFKPNEVLRRSWQRRAQMSVI